LIRYHTLRLDVCNLTATIEENNRRADEEEDWRRGVTSLVRCRIHFGMLRFSFLILLLFRVRGTRWTRISVLFLPSSPYIILRQALPFSP